MLTVNIIYGDRTLASTKEEMPLLVKYRNEIIATVGGGATKIIYCNNKYMLDDLIIGTKKLNCKGKKMEADVIISTENLESVQLDYFTISKNMQSIEIIKDL